LVLAGVWLIAIGGSDGEASPDARSFDAVLAEAVDLARAGHARQAIEMLQQFMDAAEGADWDRGRVALDDMTQAVSRSRALEFWSRHESIQLADFQEKGRLPESTWLASWGKPIESPLIRDVWLATLRQTLPEAVARSERLPDPTIIMTRFLNVEDWPNPTEATPPEEVAAHPDPWRDKLVRFDKVKLGGQIDVEPGLGYLLDVTSAAGTRFPARVGDTLLFTTNADVARQLKQLLAGKDSVRARLYCKMDTDKRLGLKGLKTFPKAMVYKLELYLSP